MTNRDLEKLIKKLQNELNQIKSNNTGKVISTEKYNNKVQF